MLSRRCAVRRGAWRAPAPIRLASLGVLYALQRVGDVFDCLVDAEDRRVVIAPERWSLSIDDWVPRYKRLHREPRDGGSMDYPECQCRVDRVGPLVLAYSRAEESRGHVTVLYASREVTDGSLERRYEVDCAASDARMMEHDAREATS